MIVSETLEQIASTTVGLGCLDERALDSLARPFGSVERG